MEGELRARAQTQAHVRRHDRGGGLGLSDFGAPNGHLRRLLCRVEGNGVAASFIDMRLDDIRHLGLGLLRTTHGRLRRRLCSLRRRLCSRRRRVCRGEGDGMALALVGKLLRELRGLDTPLLLHDARRLERGRRRRLRHRKLPCGLRLLLNTARLRHLEVVTKPFVLGGYVCEARRREGFVRGDVRVSSEVT